MCDSLRCGVMRIVAARVLLGGGVLELSAL